MVARAVDDCEMNGESYCDKPVVTVHRYYDSGVRASHGAYLLARYREVPRGVHRSYDAQGVLRGESHYDEQGQLERVRELDEQGQVVRDDAVFPDGSRRAYRTDGR